MTSNDLTKKYSKTTRIIHGVTALLIISLIPMGKYMGTLEMSEKMGLVKIHALMGMLVFALSIFRAIAFFKHKRPEGLVTGSKLNDKLVVWIHNVFYIVLFGLALSGMASMILGGYADAFATADIGAIKPKSEILPFKAHCFMVRTMLGLTILHVLGFVKHWILKKENTLKRIV